MKQTHFLLHLVKSSNTFDAMYECMDYKHLEVLLKGQLKVQVKDIVEKWKVKYLNKVRHCMQV